MIHLGNITKINGGVAPVVDCVIGGSPCQDLSFAGLMAGLAGDRSGLFFQQIRVIKEMRENDKRNGRSGVDVRCRYGIWENVPGALSSPGKGHNGEDFAVILTEFIRIAEPEAPVVPIPEKGWPTAGCLYDELGKWSVAWRIMDAQYWGVPQRRKRICLVCDFNGLNAPKIVFGEAEHHGGSQRDSGVAPVGNIGGKSRSQVRSLSQGVSGNLDESQQKGEEAAGDAGVGFGGAGKSVGFPLGFRPENVRCYDEVATTLCNGTRPGFTTGVIQERRVISVDQGGGKSGAHHYEGVSPTLTCTHGGEPAVVYAIQGSMIGRSDQNGPQGDGINEDVSFTLNTTDRHAVVYGIGSYHSNSMKSDNPHSGIYEADTSRTLDALNCGYPGCNQGGMAMVQPVVYDARGNGNGTVCGTITAGHNDRISDYSSVVVESRDVVFHPVAYGVTAKGNGDAFISEERHTSLSTGGWIPGQGYPCVMESAHYIDASHANDVVRIDCVASPLQARDYKGGKLVLKRIVRRLTPLECERLQGFPDNWTSLPQIEDMAEAEYAFWKTVLLEREMREGRARENDDGVIEIWKRTEVDGKDKVEWVNTHKPYKHKTKAQMVNWYNKMVSAESHRYKALGNSIALPPWRWVLKRLCACYERDATMASLFDGIGGFPLIWEQINGKGSCLWASEIEEFPMAVTKARFGE